GWVLSYDLTDEKTDLIRENCRRCHMPNIRIGTADARQFDPALEAQFDVVIADLPCSGFGVAGKKPEIKYKNYKETVAALSGLQKQILENAVRYVRPGGKLLYSTCTIAVEENEDNAAWLTRQFGLMPVDLRKNLPEKLQSIPTAQKGYVQLLPGDGPWDGFFFSLFVRPDTQEGNS
ncbi:MAG: 16S rRNA (cytosine(967)-C(5))-methyltransferase, partial [Eubacterium sp.]|nr:16S rRNA (cytosine(967)-C(5))-methyltransferase [Eubacterium sp.]